MIFPDVIVLKGQDIDYVKIIFKNWNVTYTIYPDFTLVDKPSKLLINGFSWKSNLIFIENDYCQLNDIQEGLKCLLFSSEPSNLSHITIKEWIPKDWEVDMTISITNWFSNDIKQLANEKLALFNIVDISIRAEYQTLKIYKQLLLVFLQPNIQHMLQWCIARKETHIKMWHTARDKLWPFVTFDSSQHIPVQSITTLNEVSNELAKVIAIEELLYTPSLKCLKHFEQHLVELFAAVKRRNQESYEHSQELKDLNKEFELLYPFTCKNNLNNLEYFRHYWHLLAVFSPTSYFPMLNR